MKKIPTLFVRDENDRRYVTSEVTPGCEWVFAGEGVGTRKYDGTCVMFDGTDWWARREVKPDKTPPPNFVAVTTDETTGKTMGWEPIAQSGFRGAWSEAMAVHPSKTGTYELCGPKVNGNPEGFALHRLIRHEDAERVTMWIDFAKPADVADFAKALARAGWEGIVWHHPDGRMAKLKVRDEHRYRDLLGDYEIEPYYKHVGCSCGWEQNIAGMSGYWSWLAAHESHVADAVTTWLAGELASVEAALPERILLEHMDGDFLVGAGRSIGNEGGDVGLNKARPTEVAYWATTAALAAVRDALVAGA